jgi:bifunctional non-homologous end joining protein LigD
MALEEYRRKRRFARTAEPKGKPRRRSSAGRRAAGTKLAGPRFVVQKHSARRLHYDLRLELDGVLKSWAVPKGPCLDPAEKRLAVHVEDHPLEYADFEGIIPKGEYGGGTVIVWDQGAWSSVEGDAAEAYRRGKLKFRLDGEKLRGAWMLVRLRPRPGEKGDNWLLIKERDAEARPLAQFDVLQAQPESALSGKTVEEVAKNPSRTWSSSRGAEASGSCRAAPVRRGTQLTPSQLRELRDVPFTHPHRLLYPERAITKLALAIYYAEVSDWILPHLARRPLSLVRCPEGNNGARFYQKHAAAGTPEAVHRIAIREKDKPQPYLMIDNLAGLLSLVQMSVLEIHPWGCRYDDIDRPDRITFDLDPDVAVAWSSVIEAARELRQRLSNLGLVSFVKTSGGKGLHIVVPIQRRHSWKEVEQFAKTIAVRMVADAPARYVAKASKAARQGKTYIDYLRNKRGATAVAAYSTRARTGAPVSAPLAWEELSPKILPDHFHVGNVSGRLAALKDDPWREMASVRQSLTASVRSRLGL